MRSGSDVPGVSPAAAHAGKVFTKPNELEIEATQQY
jgi:hypothetical protein